jgi:hypothetical protein
MVVAPFETDHHVEPPPRPRTFPALASPRKAARK